MLPRRDQKPPSVSRGLFLDELYGKKGREDADSATKFTTDRSDNLPRARRNLNLPPLDMMAIKSAQGSEYRNKHQIKDQLEHEWAREMYSVSHHEIKVAILDVTPTKIIKPKEGSSATKSMSKLRKIAHSILWMNKLCKPAVTKIATAKSFEDAVNLWSPEDAPNQLQDQEAHQALLLNVSDINMREVPEENPLKEDQPPPKKKDTNPFEPKSEEDLKLIEKYRHLVDLGSARCVTARP